MAYQRILVAIDKFCSSNRTMLEASRCFARQPGASITLLHTVRQLSEFTFYPLAAFNKLEAHYKKTAESKLNYMMAVQDLRCNTRVDFGSIKNAVKRYSEEKKPDFIVMQKGRAARSLLSFSPCDMLFVSKNQ